MKNKALIINLVGAVSFLVWAGVGFHVLQAWYFGVPPGAWTAFIAAFACLGVACEAMNRAWAHSDRVRSIMRMQSRP